MQKLPEFRLTPTRLAGAAALLFATALTACAHRAAPYVWVDDVATPQIASTDTSYVIAIGDLLSVQVFSHPEMSTRTRVRDDGKLSVPLVGDVTAVGMAPSELARVLESQLKARNLVMAARATVQLEEAAPLRVAVLGEVMRPGLYPLETGAGVAQALASAGGFTEFAHRDQLYVIRRTPTPTRIRFTYESLVRGSGRAAQFRLRPGDVVVAE
jgi:polysaccharide export outer membrane protein